MFDIVDASLSIITASVNRDIVAHNRTTICTISRFIHEDLKLEKKERKKKKNEYSLKVIYKLVADQYRTVGATSS